MNQNNNSTEINLLASTLSAIVTFGRELNNWQSIYLEDSNDSYLLVKIKKSNTKVKYHNVEKDFALGLIDFLTDLSKEQISQMKKKMAQIGNVSEQTGLLNCYVYSDNANSSTMSPELKKNNSMSELLRNEFKKENTDTSAAPKGRNKSELIMNKINENQALDKIEYYKELAKKERQKKEYDLNNLEPE